MKRKLVKICLVLSVLLSLIACQSNKKETEQVNQGKNISEKSIVVTDMKGRKVSVPSHPQRFIAIGPGCLRLYSYVGDLKQLVGIEQVEVKWGEEGRPYRMAIDNVTLYPIIGPGGPGNAPDAEMLFTAKADVVFTTYNMESAEIDELQKKIKTPIVALSYGKTSLFSPEVHDSLLLLGQVTQHESRALEIVQYFEDAQNDLQTRSQKANKKPTVYLGCQSNRGSHGIESTTGDYPAFSVLQAENVVSKAGIHQYVMLDKEKLLEMNPEVIIIDAGGLLNLKKDYLKNKQFYQSLSAFKNKKVYLQMPFNYYSTNIEIALADAYYIGTVLYPEQFSDIDPQKKFDEISMKLLGVKAYDKIAKSYFGGFQVINLEKEGK